MDFTIQNQKDTRSGFGEGLLEAGRRNPKVVAFCADLIGSLKMGDFVKEFPERFFQTGIAEANMIDMAAGMALSGFVPFTGTFAVFSTGRVYDQIRQSVAYSNKNVKIAASHAGVTLGEDGATHQILEDIGMMKMLPNMTVIVPCDFNQTKNATIAAAEYDGPVYLRFGRPKVPNFTPVDEKFIIGKAQMLQEGTDVTIFACGHLVWKAIEALPILKGMGVNAELINIHTIKPLDVEAVLKSVGKTRCVVTAEEHQRNGGLGDSIAQVLALNLPCPMEMVAVNDEFGQSGTPDELMKAYHLDTLDIVEAVKKAVSLPVTVKTRLNYEDKVDIVAFCKYLETAGADAITLHGRTKEQGYSGKAQWDDLVKVKKNIHIPLIANGDIVDATSVEACRKITNADGFMVGRAALGKPWILAEIENGRPDIVLSEVVLEHFDRIMSYYGHKGLFIARKHLAWYATGYSFVAEFRQKVYAETDEKKVRELIKAFFDGK